MNTVSFDRVDSIGTLLLANPPHNWLNAEYSVRLREAVHEASESDIRVLVVKAEGPNFCFGGEVREWPDKDLNWFRTFVAEVNASYRAIEALRIPTIASVRGGVFGGGFELALSCDFIVASSTTVFHCIEITSGMCPIAGAVQRIAERGGRATAARLAMLGDKFSAAEAKGYNLLHDVVEDTALDRVTDDLARRLAAGPTRALAATKALLKAWSTGGVPGADAIMLDTTIELFESRDARHGIGTLSDAMKAGIEPPAVRFVGA